MNPSASPSTNEKFDSLEKSYALLKDRYKTSLDTQNRISNELREVKLRLDTSLENNSTLKLKKRNLGMIFIW